MLELLEKELSIHGVSILKGGVVEVSGKGGFPVRDAIYLFKNKSKVAYKLVCKLWADLSSTLEEVCEKKSHPPEGVENIFVYSLQDLKRMLHLYPSMPDFNRIEKTISSALSKDINSFSYRIMSKVIEFKLAIDWVSHILKRNTYICSLIGYTYSLKRQSKQTNAAGVGGPFSNLDLPMAERVYEWSEIDEDIRGRDSDLKGQRRYKMGLEGYNDLWPQEGFVWRELKNEPYLWGKEGESSYPGKAGK